MNNYPILSGKSYLKILCGIVIIYCLVSWNVASKSVTENQNYLLSILQTRAETLIGTVEAGARIFDSNKLNSFSRALMQIGRQPGVAWIAIVNSRGQILMDSDSQVIGSLLYTEKELKMLQPAEYIKSRFSPDDRNVFESWKKFNSPTHLPFYIFVALSADDYWEIHNEDIKSVILNFILGLAIIISTSTLLFFIYNYRVSRNKFADYHNFSMQIIQNFPLPLISLNNQGEILIFNQNAKELLSILGRVNNINEVPGLNWQLIIDHAKKTGESIITEKSLILSEDCVVPVEINCAPIYGLSSKIIGIILIIKNLSEIKSLQRKLEQGRHLSAIGKLAAGIAHEIRNPLSSILGFAAYLKSKLIHDGMSYQVAALLEEETKRLNNVVGELLAATRKPSLNLASISLAEVLKKAHQIIENDLKIHKLSFSLIIDSGIDNSELIADKDKILQAILNLLINAIQATPENGEIKLLLKKKKSGEWEIIVKDTGIGMSEDILQSIFSPYFTTKASGTGLGLAIVRQIVESHGGDITVTSKQGAGSTFILTLNDAHE